MFLGEKPSLVPICTASSSCSSRMLSKSPSVPTTTTSPALTASLPAMASETLSLRAPSALSWNGGSSEEKRRCLRRAAVEEKRSFRPQVRDRCRCGVDRNTTLPRRSTAKALSPMYAHSRAASSATASDRITAVDAPGAPDLAVASWARSSSARGQTSAAAAEALAMRPRAKAPASTPDSAYAPTPSATPRTPALAFPKWASWSCSGT
nr:unnamed protein product [Digitaria exilis]